MTHYIVIIELRVVIWALVSLFFSTYLRQLEIKSRSHFLKVFALEQTLEQGLVVVYVKEMAGKNPRIIRINDKAKRILLKKGSSLSLLDLEA
jgi:hypothetical protein